MRCLSVEVRLSYARKLAGINHVKTLEFSFAPPRGRTKTYRFPPRSTRPSSATRRSRCTFRAAPYSGLESAAACVSPFAKPSRSTEPSLKDEIVDTVDSNDVEQIVDSLIHYNEAHSNRCAARTVTEPARRSRHEVGAYPFGRHTWRHHAAGSVLKSTHRTTIAD